MYNDCLPCIARGGLDAARFATDNKQDQLTIVKRVMAKLLEFDLDSPPPLMARFIQHTVREVTGIDDPYQRFKKKYNDFALNIYPELRVIKKSAKDRFDMAVRLAIAGNIIDFGTHNSVGSDKVLNTIDKSVTDIICGDVAVLEAAVKNAQHILWLGDNAGEIVFDKLLLEEMETDKITYVARGGYALNDATTEDLEYTGISKIVDIMDNGSDIP